MVKINTLLQGEKICWYKLDQVTTASKRWESNWGLWAKPVFVWPAG